MATISFDLSTTFIERYCGWVDDAYKEADEDTSREKLQGVFGSDFGKATKISTAKDEGYAEPPVAVDRSRFRDAIDESMNSESNRQVNP